MLDGVSLDQLRTFLAAAEEGSFSAAGRRLSRAQSVVSQTLMTLEEQLDVRLFDRAGRYPRLTPAGAALVGEAQAVLGRMDRFKARARQLVDGMEPHLAVAIDAMFPITLLAHGVRDFAREFPHTPLSVQVEALGAVVQPVVAGRCAMGIVIVGDAAELPPELVAEPLVDVELATVVAAEHPLAGRRRATPSALASHVQLQLVDRCVLMKEGPRPVVKRETWRLADTGAMHAFVRAGLGWGTMPRALVATDLEAGALVELVVDDAPRAVSLSTVRRVDTPPGPASRWLVQRLRSTLDACPSRRA